MEPPARHSQAQASADAASSATAMIAR